MEKKYLDQIYQEIINVPDFPIKGINFRDITPLFLKPKLFKKIIQELANFARTIQADIILAPESRGFLFGLPVALETNLGFVLARKPNKLPRETVSESCTLEYGTTTFHVHKDAIQPGQRVLILDDLLATGGTTNCLENLIRKLGGIPVGSAYCVELASLKGRKNLSGEILVVASFE
ncbi:adenine phosphoribosyltransferase [Mycoplasmoides fastidiosum]|uniref:Adenine phosphoribosyltransferase n=1 Tax=Mycoplasmoides fastidiosum TaxID=92758 RepID=A0ABU0LYB2_9BACT|nr:adenine phosphoribosyltransferase [Mycoplasmoides fastidiosum]MDQ0513701.1 adenine phosphoribosyltransferase [Mycoplasmoides fastidiosum]UUD37876.1 adenine phosphoribosyltransferase [Mycoplasmoides fastidiosum]